MKKYWYSVRDAFKQELSWSTIVYSAVWGVWIAFCPFIGFHTLFCFMAAWIFSLNVAIILGLSLCINNPWTMVPIYYFDYIVGYFFYDRVIGYIPENPLWMQSMIIHFQQHVHVPSFSLWAFIVGGVLTATVAACAVWGIMLWYASVYHTKGVRQ